MKNKLLMLVFTFLLIFLTACKKERLAPVEFSVEGGAYGKELSITLSQIQDADIYYTINGKAPDTSLFQKGKKKYKSGEKIVLSVGNTYSIKAIAMKKKSKPSEVVEQVYELKESFSKPSFNLENRTITTEDVFLKIFYEDYEKGKAEIRYTLDNKEPTEKSFLYDEFGGNLAKTPFNTEKVIPFTENKYYILKAKIISKDPKYLSSETVSIEFQIDKTGLSKGEGFTLNEQETNEIPLTETNKTNKNDGIFFSSDLSEKNSIKPSVSTVDNPIYFSSTGSSGNTNELPTPFKEEKKIEVVKFDPIIKRLEKTYNETIVDVVQLNSKFYVLSNVNNKSVITTYNEEFNQLDTNTIEGQPKKLKLINSNIYLLSKTSKYNLYSINKDLTINKLNSFEDTINDFTYLNKNLYTVITRLEKYYIVNVNNPNIYVELKLKYADNIPFQLTTVDKNLYLFTEKDDSKGITSINVLSFDSSLNIILNKLYGGGNREFFSKGIVKDDKIYLIGTTSSYRENLDSNYSNFILGLDKKGNIIKSKAFSTEDEKGTDLIIKNNKFYILSSAQNSIKFYTLTNSLDIEKSETLSEGKGKGIFISNGKAIAFGNYQNKRNDKSLIFSKSEVN